MTEQVELVTVGRFGEPMEAEMAKGRLDSAGIRSFLVGENTAILYGTGLGGLQLQVSPQDEADARTILEDPGQDTDRDHALKGIESDGEEPAGE